MRDPAKTAAAWFARRRGAPLREQEQRAFEAWLAEDLDHRVAYADAERAWAVTEVVLDDPRIRARRVALERRTRPGRHWVGGALAAGLAVGVVGGGLWTVRSLTEPKSLATQAFHTDVGQRSTVTLPDGSVVTLNTDTVLRTRADGERRLVYLDKGQAFFRVAKDRRHPFIVNAGGRTVTAIGTAFDVRLEGGELKVVLVEGKVRVEGKPPVRRAPADPAHGPAAQAKEPPDQSLATEMLAGSELIVPVGADWRLTRADTTRETSWIHGQIIFDNQPLGEVVSELNRYSEQKMVIDNPRLAARPISGAFRPGDVQGFARSLQSYGYAYVSAEDGQRLYFAPIKSPENSSRGKF